MAALSWPMGQRPYSRNEPPTTYAAGKESEERGNLQRAIPFAFGLLSIALTDNATITLPTQANGVTMYAGQTGFLQVIQDATGGWAPTWTNATATDGSVPAPSTDPFDATLYQWVYDGSVFILSLYATRYASGATDPSLALALDRMTSALLPLPRVEVLVPGYALEFA